MSKLTQTISVYDDGTVSVMPTISPVPAPVPSPAPISSMVKGTFVDTSDPVSRDGPLVQQIGCGWVRLWCTISNWNNPPTVASDLFSIERQWKVAGYKTLTVFTPPEVTGSPAPTPATASAWFQAAIATANGAIDAWEIGNEMNLANYNVDYAAHASSWITNMLQPAYQVLHTAGQKIVSGGWSEGPNNGFAYALQKGLLNFCDIVGYHGYGPDAATHISRVMQVRQMVGSKPIWETEFNIHGNVNDPAGWMSELNKAAAGIGGLVQGIFHFKLIQNASAAGVAAPFDANGQPRNIWYDGTVAAMNNF